MSAVMLNCISLNANNPSTHPAPNAMTTSSRQTTPREKCTCKVAEVPFSSSSTSVVSEHFPVKHKTQQKEMPKVKYVPPSNRTIVITCMAPRPARLQPHTHSHSRDQYYSCSSEDSDVEEILECNKSQGPAPDAKPNKFQAILQLLQEIIILLNTSVVKREDPLRTPPAVSSALQDKYCGIPPAAPESEMNFPPPPPPPPLPFEPQPEPEPKAEPVPVPKAVPVSVSVPIAQAPVTAPHWCPCYCFAQGMAMATGGQPPMLPCMQPLNVQAAASREQPTLKPVVHEGTEDSFKDCLSSSIASAMGKDADFVCVQITSVGDVPSKGRSSKDFTPLEAEMLTSAIGDKKLVKKIDEDILRILGERPSFDHHKNYGPGLDSLEQYEDEEPRLEMPNEDILRILGDRPSFDHHKNYGPGLDSLEQYEDEEPDPGEKIQPVIREETPTDLSSAVTVSEQPVQELEKGPETDKTDKTGEPEQSAPEATDHEKQPETDKIVEPEQSVTPEKTDQGKEPETDKTGKPEQSAAPEITDQGKEPETDKTGEPEQSATEPIYGFMTEEEQSNEKQMIRYVESEEDESYYPYGESEIFDDDSELFKEKRAESLKRKESLEDEEEVNHLQEMKFFIDSIIMDLEAMDYARRRSQCEKKLCKPKPSICCRESFPVTITEVEDLGTTSLYVKWIIHDCCGIGGYELYTDGYLTNRFYHAKHEAAVITNVDITMPHKISLVAQPSTQEDTIELICDIGNNKTATKSLPWKSNMDVERKALYTLWTPSVYLYSPPTCPIASC